jgi:Xaa-Pro aminopeptidase
VADPFTAAPPLLLLQGQRTLLIVPTLYLGYADGSSCEVVESRTHRFRGTPPDPYAELAAVLRAVGVTAGPTGVQGRTLPAFAHERLRELGAEAVWVDDLVVHAERVKQPIEIAAIRKACQLADTLQQAVKDLAQPGQTEAELAGLAQARLFAAAGRRVPAVLTLNAGAASALPSAIPGDRAIAEGDLVLTDTSPWMDGAWSDTANAVVVGRPTAQQQRMFDAVRRALDHGITLCRPGAVAGDVDAAVRDCLADWGDARYGHHTGHGLGSSWSQPPHIIPGSADRIEEGMVLCIEPALYVAGFGGVRLEHVFHVGADGNELLSHFEHAL